MKYRMQIHLYDPQKTGWFFINGPDGKPYEYTDHNLAYRMLRMCYPNLSIGDQARITDQDGNHQPTPVDNNIAEQFLEDMQDDYMAPDGYYQ